MRHNIYKFWSKDEIKLLKKLYPNFWAGELVSFFPKRNEATIIAKARAIGLQSAKLWQPEENEIINKYFYELRKEELSKLLPRRPWGAILARGERLRLSRNRSNPRLKVNENYFKKWSHEMAYILGFILADGCIVKPKRLGHSDVLKFGVHVRDVDILEKIKRELESDHKISKLNRAAHLAIVSQILVDDLKNLGITYRKSLSENIPTLPKVFMSDFIRGIVDGDGGIRIDKKGYPNLMICGGEKVMRFIQRHFLRRFDIYSKVSKRTTNKDGAFLCNIAYKCNSAKVLLKYLYDGAELYLDRKFNIAKECLDIDIGFKKNYTNRELKIIRKFSQGPRGELLKLLPNRKWENIQAKAKELGLLKNRRRDAIGDR